MYELLGEFTILSKNYAIYTYPLKEECLKFHNLKIGNWRIEKNFAKCLTHVEERHDCELYDLVSDYMINLPDTELENNTECNWQYMSCGKYISLVPIDIYLNKHENMTVDNGKVSIDEYTLNIKSDKFVEVRSMVHNGQVINISLHLVNTCWYDE
jgi:hypothetical protein